MTTQHSTRAAVGVAKPVTDQGSWLGGMQVSTSVLGGSQSYPVCASPSASTSSILTASVTPSSVAGSLPLTFCSPVLSPHSIREDAAGQGFEGPHADAEQATLGGSLHSANSKSDSSLVAHTLPAESLLERCSSLPLVAANRARGTAFHSRPLPRFPTLSHIPPSRSISLDHKVHRGILGEEKRVHGGLLKNSPKKAFSALNYFSLDPTSSSRVVAATDARSLGMVLTSCSSLNTLQGMCKAGSGYLYEDTRLALSPGTSLATSSSTLSAAVSRAPTDAGLGDLLGPFATDAQRFAVPDVSSPHQEPATLMLWASPNHNTDTIDNHTATQQVAVGEDGTQTVAAGSPEAGAGVTLRSTPAIPITRTPVPGSSSGICTSHTMGQTTSNSSSSSTPSAFAQLTFAGLPAITLHPASSGVGSIQVLSPSPSLGAVYKVYPSSTSPQASPSALQTGRLLERSVTHL